MLCCLIRETLQYIYILIITTEIQSSVGGNICMESDLKSKFVNEALYYSQDQYAGVKIYSLYILFIYCVKRKKTLEVWNLMKRESFSCTFSYDINLSIPSAITSAYNFSTLFYQVFPIKCL